MGMGSSATEMVFFITGVALATAVVLVASGAVQHLSGDINAHADDLGARLRSDIRIINDPAHVVTSPLTVLVKNVGDATLHPSLFSVLYDGVAQTGASFDVLGRADDTKLGRADVLQITVPGLSVAAGDHAVVVVTDAGVQDQLSFTVSP